MNEARSIASIEGAHGSQRLEHLSANEVQDIKDGAHETRANEEAPLSRIQKKESGIPLFRRVRDEHSALSYDRKGKVIGLKNEEFITAQEALMAVSSKLSSIQDRIERIRAERKELEDEIHSQEAVIQKQETLLSKETDEAEQIDIEEGIELLKQDVLEARAEFKARSNALEGLAVDTEAWIALKEEAEKAYEEQSAEAEDAVVESDEVAAQRETIVIPNPFYREGAGEHVLKEEESFDRSRNYEQEELLDWREAFLESREVLKERLNDIEVSIHEAATEGRLADIQAFQQTMNELIDTLRDTNETLLNIDTSLAAVPKSKTPKKLAA